MAWIIAGAALVGAAAQSSSAKSAANKQAGGTSQAIQATDRQYEQGRSDLAPYREAGSAALSRLRSLLGISSGVDESDPRYKALLDPMIANIDQQHIDKFGMSAFDPRADSSGTQAWVDRAKKDASDQYLAKYGAQTPTSTENSELLRKFSTEDLNADPVYNSGLQFGLDEGTKAIERRAAAGGGYDSGATLKGLTRFANDYGSTKAGESYGRFTNDQDRTYGKLSGIAGMGSGATTVGVNAGANQGTNLSNLITGGANAQGAASIAGGNAIASGANSMAQYAMLRQLTGGGQRTTTPTNMSLLGE